MADMAAADAELIHWRLLGAVVWQVAMTLLAVPAWRFATHAPGLLLHPLKLLAAAFGLWSLGTAVALAALQAAASWAFSQLLAVQERVPAKLPRPFAAVFGTPLGPLAVAAAVYAASGAASAALLAAAQGHATHLGWLSGFGAVAGVAFLGWALAAGWDVLRFPQQRRRRHSCLAERLPTATAMSARVTALAALLVGAAGLLGVCSGAPLALWRSALSAGLLLAFLWYTGVALLGIVFGERLDFVRHYGGGHQAALLAALSDDKAPLLQQLAFQELAAVSQPPFAARRAGLWADDSGELWRAAVAPCLQQVDSMMQAVAEATSVQPATGGRIGGGAGGQTPGAGNSAPKWNQPNALLARGHGRAWPLRVAPHLTIQLAAAAAALAPHRGVGWRLRSQRQRTEWAMQALAGLAAASRQEDRYGVAQLSDPGLPAVLQALAAAVSGFKAAAALPPRLGGAAVPGNGAAAHPQAQQLLAGETAVRQQPNVAAELAEAAQQAVMRIAGAFGGAAASDFLAAAAGPAAFGSAKDAANVLQASLDRLQQLREQQAREQQQQQQQQQQRR